MDHDVVILRDELGDQAVPLSRLSPLSVGVLGYHEAAQNEETGEDCEAVHGDVGGAIVT